MSALHDIAANAKSAYLVIAGTLASGLAQLVGIIPDEIGKLATLVGIVLSLVMINYWRAQRRKTQLESEMLIEQIKKLRAGNDARNP